MERLTINATVRQADADLELLRGQGRIPAVIYGGDREGAQSISVDRSELLQLMKQVTESTLVDVSIDGTASTTLIGEVQLHAISEEILHIDFRQVDAKKPVKTAIALNFVGEAPAVKLGGLLMHGRDAIRVSALPEALVPSIDVDLSLLVDFEAAIQVKDIALPEGVTLLDDPNAAVALVRVPKKRVEVEEVTETAEGEGEEGAAEGEGDGEKKAEGEKAEGAEEKKAE